MESSILNIIKLVSLIESLLAVARKGRLALRIREQLTFWVSRSVQYENALIDLILDIQDLYGRRAVLAKRQRVVCRARDVVIRDLAWGEGEAIAGYSSRGARRLGVNAEGSKKAVLLVPSHEPEPGRILEIRSRRLIRAGFQETEEYFDTLVERPTRRLALKIVFPRARPPSSARIVSEGHNIRAQTIPVRFGSDGRPFLAWHRQAPEMFRTYSLRWRW